MTQPIDMTASATISAPPPGPATGIGPDGDLLALPDAAALPPLDALGHLMLLIELGNIGSLKSSSVQLESTRERLEETLKELIEKLEEAAREAQSSGRRRKGFFKKLTGKVGDAIGKAVGTIAEVVRDGIVVPLDVADRMAKNLVEGKAIFSGLGDEMAQFVEASDTARSFEAFAAGATRLAADFIAFESTALLAIAADAVKGEPLGDAVLEQGRALWQSVKENALENPGFMETVGLLAKAAAVAGTVVSGGALAVAAVALFVVLEAEKRYDITEHTLGKDAVPYVRVGLELAFAACAAGAGIASTVNRAEDFAKAVKTVKTVTQAIDAGAKVNAGVTELVEAPEQRRRARREIRIEQLLFRQAELQRLVELIIDSYENKSEHRTDMHRMGANVVRLEGAADQAAIMRA